MDMMNDQIWSCLMELNRNLQPCFIVKGGGAKARANLSMQENPFSVRWIERKWEVYNKSNNSEGVTG